MKASPVWWVVWALWACGTATQVDAAPPREGAGEAGPIRAVAAKASSALKPYKGHTFGAENLLDGRVDTSWQPVGGTTLGVGQWAEIDLGATYDVTGVELELGLQVVDPALGDLFCRNTRPSYVVMAFDDGAWALVSSPRADAKTVPRSREALMRGKYGVASVKTRRIRLVVSQVEAPVDWKDVAIAEVRVFGRPAPDLVGEEGGACGARGYVPFSTALIEYCAGLDTSRRARLRCGELVSDFLRCRASGPFGLPGPVQEVAMPPVLVNKEANKVTVTAGVEVVTFERAASGWRVTHIEPRPMQDIGRTEGLVREDLQRENRCWEALGKKRPYEDWDKDLPDFPPNPEFE